MKQESKRIALCGLLCALALTLMLMGGIIPVATFCAPMLAMVALLPVLIEFGPRYAAAAYGAVSLLCLLLVPDPETALVYVFFGWYPLLRPRIAALPARVMRVVCRLAVCTGAACLLYGVVISVLGLPAAEEIGSGWFAGLLLVLANAVFLLLDRALANLTFLWQKRLRRRFFR